ncbi:hypothetical protein SDC9_57791 [bioreactor metagenome]|uniref:DpnD/PcfM-like C-terminal domain-containing protein n=1 Tax=bioreactor metagenome TaxID=1076179 RepID=A0A644X670_9ZZZZ
MKEFVIRIVETLATSVIMEADSLDEALSKTNDLYQSGEIVLTYDDYSDTEFEEAATDLNVAKELLFKRY